MKKWKSIVRLNGICRLLRNMIIILSFGIITEDVKHCFYHFYTLQVCKRFLCTNKQELFCGMWTICYDPRGQIGVGFFYCCLSFNFKSFLRDGKIIILIMFREKKMFHPVMSYFNVQFYFFGKHTIFLLHVGIGIYIYILGILS